MSERPKPPAGHATWLDFCVEGPHIDYQWICEGYGYAGEELAELRALVAAADKMERQFDDPAIECPPGCWACEYKRMREAGLRPAIG